MITAKSDSAPLCYSSSIMDFCESTAIAERRTTDAGD